jgi:dihydropteroate synthase
MNLCFPGSDLDLTAPVVMGIVNVTPDSFSDGGRYRSPEAAVEHGVRLAADGAAILDVGGESTRPGARPVSVAEEMDRVLFVIEGLAAATGVPVSVDTSKPEVMRAAAKAGASMINDVNALRAEGALLAAAETGLPVCLMHMQGEPRTMQDAPAYDDVVEDVFRFLADRIAACRTAGMDESRIVVDPGFGFGKTLEHNLQLMKRLERITDLGRPLLIGVSRKSMIGAVLDRPVDERLSGGLALGVLAIERGARILRVHDVRETMDVIRMTTAVLAAEDGRGPNENG